MVGVKFVLAFWKMYCFVLRMMVFIGRLFLSVFRCPRIISICENASLIPAFEWIQFSILFHKIFTFVQFTNRWIRVSGSELQSLQLFDCVIPILCVRSPTPKIRCIVLYWSHIKWFSWTVWKVTRNTLFHVRSSIFFPKSWFHFILKLASFGH